MSLSTSFPPTITSKVSAKKSMFSNLARMVAHRTVSGQQRKEGAERGAAGIWRAAARHEAQAPEPWSRG